MDDNPKPNPPRDVLRDGNLKASIWRNDGEQGPFYAVDLARTYRDDQGELQDSRSFAGGDLLRISELARRCYERLGDLRREDRATEQDKARDASPSAPEREQRRQSFRRENTPPRQQRQPGRDR
jgi:hypothetical protein